MKWRGLTETVAESECGAYQVKLSVCDRGRFYNAWRTADNKHIDASHDKAKVLRACEADAMARARQGELAL